MNVSRGCPPQGFDFKINILGEISQISSRPRPLRYQQGVRCGKLLFSNDLIVENVACLLNIVAHKARLGQDS